MILNITDKADSKYMLEWIDKDECKCGFVLEDGGKVFISDDGEINIPRVGYKSYVYKDLILNIDLILFRYYDIKMDYTNNGLCVWVEYKK